MHGKIELFFFCFKYEINFLIHRELNDNINEEELKAMIDEFDLDGDGESKITSFYFV